MKVIAAGIGVLLVAGIILVIVGLASGGDDDGNGEPTPAGNLGLTPDLTQEEVVSRVNDIICPGRRLNPSEAFPVQLRYLTGDLWDVKEQGGERSWNFNEGSGVLRANNELTLSFEGQLRSSPGCFPGTPEPDAEPSAEASVAPSPEPSP